MAVPRSTNTFVKSLRNMNESQQEQYRRIAKAIRFIISARAQNPTLEEIAAAAHYSPFHFQKIFSEHTGISPKKFLQYLNISHAQSLFSGDLPLDALSRESGLSGNSRLHELFISIEAMTPAEFRKGGAALNIRYSFLDTPFGQVIVASTPKGICHLAFCIDPTLALSELRSRFPAALYSEETTETHLQAIQPICTAIEAKAPIHLHIKGSPFQLKVWEALLKIPTGYLTSYGQIAKHTGDAKASRAAGTAIGANPIAYLIPCHRVIRSSGLLGGYRWGLDCKEALLAWEKAGTDFESKLDNEPVVS